MRIPRDLATEKPPRHGRRARWWIAGIVVVLIVLLVSLRSLATIYTDSLWFSSVGYHNVFSTLLAIKLGLFGVFGAIFFVVLWVNLVVCDRIAGRDVVLAQEDELVRRYQQYVRPYAGRIYVALAFVLALIGASGTIGQWNNWILFLHGGNFDATDPQFHKNVGFYVFDLPFLTFLVDWTLAILIVTLAVTVVFHYFNGGIQPQRGLPRVRPSVKAHLSVLLALIALDKAAGYVLQRWSIVNSQDGYVDGAGYTDIHARLPAETLLVVVSIFAAGILLFNIRRQGWTLPVLAIGIWAFVALTVGIIYPALLQTLKVTPAQSSLEAPYIQRNITATRDAYGLNDVQVHNFAASNTITASQVLEAEPTISTIRQWDPDPTITLQTFQREQAIRSYYTFPSLGVDRYTVGKSQVSPVLIGVREISSSNIPSPSWVNTHLQYTHGNGAVVALANQTNSNNPVYAVQGIPPNSTLGLPAIKQPSVYFGLGETGYVVADTKQLEVDYQQDGTAVESHYSGKDATGGVQLSSLIKRAAFALRLGDFNLLISSQITPKSRIMFVRDPLAMAEKAAPFLSFDHDPYAVINDGQIDWVVDGYTTTANYPYSQNASSQQVAVGSTLPGSYNYVRNSVKVVINAYTGQMTFYDVEPNDPIIQAYEAAFPHMFTPLSKMSPSLQAHLRYPEDIFSIQSAIFGRYHLTNPQAFYAASNAWQLSPTAGAGPQSAGPAGREHLQQPGATRLDHAGPDGSPVPGVRAPGYDAADLHHLQRVRPGVSIVVGQRLEPELQPDGVDGRSVRPRELRPARRLRDPARDPRARERRRGDLGQQDGVGGHLAARPEGLRGAPGRDLDGPDRQLHGLSAPAVRGLDDEPAAEPAVRRRRAGEERADRIVSVVGALRSAAGRCFPPQRKRRPLDRNGAVGGDRVPQRRADRLHQRARRAEGAEPRRVPDGDSGHGAADPPGPTSARRDGNEDGVDDHDDDGAAREEGQVGEADLDHELLGADQHRAEGLDPHDVAEAGLHHEHLTRLGSPEALRP